MTVWAFFGRFLGLFGFAEPPVSMLILVLYGAVLGPFFHALSFGLRGFSSVGSMGADHDDVMVDEEVAGDTARIVAGPR